MTDKPRRAGSLIVLAGGILLTVVVVVIFLAPVATCPFCDFARALDILVTNASRSDPVPESEFKLKGCEFCWRGRMSPYRRWKLEHEGPPPTGR